MNPLVEQRLREQQQSISSSIDIPSSTIISTTTPSTHTNNKSSISSSRMDWMTNPDSIRSVLTKDTADENKEKILTKEEIIEQERQKRIQEEIQQGLREPITGLPYGLYQRKAGEKWLGGELESENTTSKSNITDPENTVQQPIIPMEVNSETRTKLLRPDQSVSSGTTSTTISTTNAPSWKQKLLERQKEKNTTNSTNNNDEININNTSNTNKRSYSDMQNNVSSSLDTAALQKIINGETNTSSSLSTASIPTNSSNISASSSTVPLPVTEADFNRLHAMSIRAQMMGDNDKYTMLQNQIKLGKEQLLMNTQPAEKRSRPDLPHPSPDVPASTTETVEILSTLDAYGRPIASLASGKEAQLVREDLKSGSRAGKLKMNLNAFNEDGERQGYLPDDIRTSQASGNTNTSSSSSAIDLLRMERNTSSHALDDTLMRNIIKAGTRYHDTVFSSRDKTGKDEVDNSYDDNLVKAMTSSESRLTAHEQQERERQKAIQLQKQLNTVLSNCRYCIDSKTHSKHLIISLGNYCYLTLPPNGPRLPGHLQLVPLTHITGIIDGEEELYEEINQYKLALHNYYTSQQEGVIFLETSLQNNKKHTVIDIIPMDKEIADDAPLFFQKGILDSEEWTTNKTLINTAGKGLRKCIPKGFAYFHVAWAGGGFVHPIEDEQTFSPYFGLDIAAGMVGELPGKFGYKENKLTKYEEQELINNFIKTWEPYDFTIQKKTSKPINNSSSSNNNSSTTNNNNTINNTTSTTTQPVVTTINNTNTTSSSTTSTNTTSTTTTTATNAPRRRLL